MISSITGRTHVVDDRADGDFEYQPHQRASARADGLLPDSDSFTMPSPQFAYFSFLKHRNFAEVDEKGPCRQRDPFSCSNNSSMNLSPPPASADLAGIAKVYCQDEENAAQLARVASELISENPALIIGVDIMLSIEEFISYLAQE